MGLLVNLLLRASDLVEAEVRYARRAASDVVASTLLLVTAMFIGLLALAALAAALLTALCEVMSTPAALACIGTMLGVIAAVVFAIARTMTGRRGR